MRRSTSKGGCKSVTNFFYPSDDAQLAAFRALLPVLKDEVQLPSGIEYAQQLQAKMTVSRDEFLDAQAKVCRLGKVPFCTDSSPLLN